MVIDLISLKVCVWNKISSFRFMHSHYWYLRYISVFTNFFNLIIFLTGIYINLSTDQIENPSKHIDIVHIFINPKAQVETEAIHE